MLFVFTSIILQDMVHPDQDIPNEQPTVWVKGDTVFRQLGDKVVVYRPKNPDDLNEVSGLAGSLERLSNLRTWTPGQEGLSNEIVSPLQTLTE